MHAEVAEDERIRQSLLPKPPKQGLIGFKKGAVTLCALVGFGAGFTVGASWPNPEEVSGHYMDKAVAYSAVVEDLKPLVVDGVSAPVEHLFYEYHEKKEQAVDDAQTLKNGGWKAYVLMAKAPSGTYAAAKRHLADARLVDFGGTWAPGLLLGGLGLMIGGGLGYELVKRRK